MSCFSPLDAWRGDDGVIRFLDRGDGRRLQLPCGQCIGCRLERSRQWAMRCVHEAALYDRNSFVTLTYDEDHYRPSLCYRDFQLFMKRARRKFGPFRFYMCGEYGDTFFRPHFHACLFGLGFPDRVLLRDLPSGSRVYRSAVLESLWDVGFSSIGDVTFESAAYVARYVTKKVFGEASAEHYKRVDVRTGEIVDVEPEFSRMSLKPGIGADWIRRFRADVYRSDGDVGVVMNGHRVKPPRYYDKLAERWVDDFSILCERETRTFEHVARRKVDNTPERLAVRERCARARLVFKKRSLE